MKFWWILVLVILFWQPDEPLVDFSFNLFYFSCLMNLWWILVLVILFSLLDEPLVDLSFSNFILAA